MVRRRNIKPAVTSQEEIDSYFQPPRDDNYGTIDASTLPHAARTAVEFLHDQDPDAVIAADRGGRMFAFGIFYSWHKRYPGERFPTRDRKLHIARLSKNMTDERFGEVFDFTLARAQVTDEGSGMVVPDASRKSETPKLTFIDDWVFRGRTLDLFIRNSLDAGFREEDLAIITMCNRANDRIAHAVNPYFVGWEGSRWKDDSVADGVEYYDYETPVPRAMPNETSRREREAIVSNTDSYYSNFEAALKCGAIVLQSS